MTLSPIAFTLMAGWAFVGFCIGRKSRGAVTVEFAPSASASHAELLGSLMLKNAHTHTVARKFVGSGMAITSKVWFIADGRTFIATIEELQE